MVQRSARLGKALWEAAGKRVSPRIVFEHPGEATLPTSIFLVATGGMVVICAPEDLPRFTDELPEAKVIGEVEKQAGEARVIID